SRSFVLATLRALHHDTGPGSALSTSRSKRLKTSLTTHRPFRDDNLLSIRPACGLEFLKRLEQSEQLQVGDGFEDDRRRDVRDVVVRADFGFLYRSTESVGRGQGPADRLGGLQIIGIAQRRHPLQRVRALSIRQNTQGGLKPLHPLPKVSDALD